MKRKNIIFQIAPIFGFAIGLNKKEDSFEIGILLPFIFIDISLKDKKTKVLKKL